MSNDVPSPEFVVAFFKAMWPVYVKDEAVEVELLNVYEGCPRPEILGWAGDHWHILAARNFCFESHRAEPTKSLFAILCHACAHVRLGHHGRLEDGSPPLWEALAEERAQLLGAVDGSAAADWVARNTAPLDEVDRKMDLEANQLAADMVIDAWPVLMERWQNRPDREDSTQKYWSERRGERER